MKGLIKFIVAVYVVITGLIGGFAYLGYDTFKSIKLKGKAKETFDGIKKNMIGSVLYVVFCWPYILIKNIKGILGVRKEIKTWVQSEKTQATIDDICDIVDDESNQPKDLSEEEKEEWNKAREEKYKKILERYGLVSEKE
ncbi:MAG: hypothetical protein J6Y02_11305 [Pseudobutyrivibrio sp.]|nr:hypothetical protein [Pseudobutyrivibrio sp.]